MTATTFHAESLTPAEKAAFEENGYHVLREALTPAQTAKYRQALKAILRLPADHPYLTSLGKSGLPDERCVAENPHGIWAGFDLPLFDECFYDLAFHPKLALTVDALIGPDINLYETSFISKPPHFPADFRDWHQDSEYSDPSSNDRAVTVIIALDPLDAHTGCTLVAPGTHRLGPLPHVLPTEPISSGALEVAEKRQYDAGSTGFDLKPGDALIFLVRLVHKSGPNESETMRLSLAYNYVRKDCLDLKNKARYVGVATPITRNGSIYTPAP